MHIVQLNIFCYYLSDNMVVHTQPTESGHMGGGSKYHVVTFNLTKDKPHAITKGVNMDIEKIEKFLDAGYTKAEIDELIKGAGSGAEDAGKETEDAGKEQGATKQENGGKVENTADETLKALTETVKGLTETVKAMQTKAAETATGGKAENNGINDVMKSFIEKL